jgi:hypothetical protein
VLGLMSESVAAGPRRVRLDASRLPAGMYLMRARQGSESVDRRVIVVR